MTRLVLTNAIYFNAAWADAFEEDLTQDDVFYLLDGGQVSVPMMRQTTTYGYAEADGVQAVELPYDGRELAMVILLPQVDKFESFESSLDAERVDAILNSMVYREVALTMPRFETESSFSLVQALAAMGMPDAFHEGADFSGMDGTSDLFISDILHKAFVLVGEEGTEAAAATAVIIKAEAVSAEPPPVVVTVDHPFVFFIRDIETGTILFVGRIMNPEA
jgi:serpin B